jgi:hypothetical protein
MNMISNSTPKDSKGDLRSILAKRNNFDDEERIFCTRNNLEQSLDVLNEVIERERSDFKRSSVRIYMCVRVY